MQRTYDDNYKFRDRNGNEVLCHLTIYQNHKGEPEQTIVITTELADNPGQSITNCYGRLADMVTAAHRLKPEHTLWVEHYNAESYSGKALEPNEDDRYSLVQMSYDGKQFSQARFAPLKESQLHGLLESTPPQEAEPWTLIDVNIAGARFGIRVEPSNNETYQNHPLVIKDPKTYVAVNDKGKVLTTLGSLNAASMFLTLWAMSHQEKNQTTIEPLEPEAEVQALATLNAIAKPKKLRVITSDTPGYQHHDWAIKYECRYAVINQHGTVITTARDLEVAETVVLLAADQDADPLEL